VQDGGSAEAEARTVSIARDLSVGDAATGIDNPGVRRALEKTGAVIKEQAWFRC